MSAHRRPSNASIRAFTLVEAVAVITVLAALGTVASLVIGGAARSYSDAAARSELNLALSVALDQIDRELRNIELDAGASGIAPDIDLVGTDRIEWGGDWSVGLDGSDLEIVRAGASSAVLVQGVTTLTIKAFDEGNTQLAASLSGAACDGIRRLSVEIVAQRGVVTEMLRTKVFIRSTMSGASAS